MSANILVVDDDKDIADLLEMYLANENYTVYKFYDASHALEKIDEITFDLAILDVMMPKIDGFTMCKMIREKYNFPIIMLTAKDEETDQITGLTFGADDYVKKPFRPLELMARVKANLRRYQKYDVLQNEEKSLDLNVLEYKKLRLDIGKRECRLDQEIISLTPTEFAILELLLERQGQAVNLEELFHLVWKDEYYTKNSSAITVHIRHLREKLQDVSDKPEYIKTVWGVGYKI